MTFHWKAVEQYFTVMLFVFQFYPVCNFAKFIEFRLGTVKVPDFSITDFEYVVEEELQLMFLMTI